MKRSSNSPLWLKLLEYTQSVKRDGLKRHVKRENVLHMPYVVQFYEVVVKKERGEIVYMAPKTIHNFWVKLIFFFFS